MAAAVVVAAVAVAVAGYTLPMARWRDSGMPADARIEAPCALLKRDATNRLLSGADAVVAPPCRKNPLFDLPHQARLERGVVGDVARERGDASVQSDKGRVVTVTVVAGRDFPFEFEQHAQRRSAWEAGT